MDRRLATSGMVSGSFRPVYVRFAARQNGISRTDIGRKRTVSAGCDAGYRTGTIVLRDLTKGAFLRT